MSNNWRKIENEEGFPFYVNEQNNVKQWDHPKFSDIRQRIDDCNYVKYSTYRVAIKFRVLQHALHMEEMPLRIIAGVFDRHRLGANESSLHLESCDLEAVLSDVYFAANKTNHTNIDIDFATELMLNFLYNIYDVNRKGKIQVSCTKLVLAVLSNCTLDELHKFMFEMCADHNNCVTRLRLQSLLSKLVEVTNFLHEDVSFGNHLVNSSIESCFSNSPGLVGINESSFISWLEKPPQLLAWLPLLHRMKTAESVVHFVKCTTCKTTPIMGLRYKCIKCSRYTQCQRCFLTGRTSQSHKLSHSMREYLTQGNSSELGYAFLKKLCSLLPCSISANQVSVVETKPLRSENHFCKKSESTDVLCDIEPLSSPQTQLQVIIRQLELQNRELQNILQLGSTSTKDKEMKRYLEDHRIHVAAQIQKLKILKDYIRLPDASPKLHQRKTIQSTPMMEFGRQKPVTNMDVFSPIVQENEFTSVHPNFLASMVAQEDTSPYSINDISTWIGGHPAATSQSQKPPEKSQSPGREFHSELDDALAKLQQILANNFALDESIGSVDNSNLKHAVCEVEGMLTSFIDNVETSRASSVLPLGFQTETELLSEKV